MAEALGADATVDYTASASPAELRAALVRASGGAPFDLCLDAVTSKDGVDAAWAYPLVVSGAAIDGAAAAGGPAAGPPGAKAGARPPVPLLAGRYVTIGGSFADWLRAGMGKVLRVDPYGAERALFWIRFPRTRGELEELARMVEDGELSPVVAREVPFDSASVARAVEVRALWLACGRVAPSTTTPHHRCPKATYRAFGLADDAPIYGHPRSRRRPARASPRALSTAALRPFPTGAAGEAHKRQARGPHQERPRRVRAVAPLPAWRRWRRGRRPVAGLWPSRSALVRARTLGAGPPDRLLDCAALTASAHAMRL